MRRRIKLPRLSPACGPHEEPRDEATQPGDEEGDGEGGELRPGLAQPRPPLRHGREHSGPVSSVTTNMWSLSLSQSDCLSGRLEQARSEINKLLITSLSGHKDMR